ncbi:MAG: dihydropteroate synthase [Bacteroidales bacterium]|jgi:dihydropteroate synthase|nr:dihydropteroate synthase [Bacteroidales bacterium]
MPKHINFNSLKSPVIMGIVNITPDSFYDGGKHTCEKELLQHVEKMLREGADIIDIGAYSSRPGADSIDENEECERLKKNCIAIRKNYPHIPISIDSFRSSVIKKIYEAIGPIIVNDISGGNFDSEMIKTCGKLQLPYICMHMRGTPQTMQNHTEYSNILAEIKDFFQEKIKQAQAYSVPHIILDPGLGFSKTLEQNYFVLRNIDYFKSLQKPILIGVSRKSMIYKKLNCTPHEALNGTSVLHTISVLNGASILRVHDVKEAKESIILTQEILNQKIIL